VHDFVADPHTGIAGAHQGTIMNLVDTQAAPAHKALIAIAHESPDATLQEVRHLVMPSHHDVRAENVDLKRLGAVLAVAHERDLKSFADLLLVENLLDTTHLPFLHPTSLGTDAFARSELEVTREGDRIQVARWLMNELPAPFHKQMGEFPDGQKVDRWQIAHFGPPCFVKLDVGSAPAGAGSRQVADRGSRWMNMWNLNAITPETDKTAHYFFAQAFNFKLDQKWIADMLAVQIRDIFLEDMSMVKAQQVNMDLGPSPVVNLGQDKAWVAMRQIVYRLAKEEQQTAKAA